MCVHKKLTIKINYQHYKKITEFIAVEHTHLSTTLDAFVDITIRICAYLLVIVQTFRQIDNTTLIFVKTEYVLSMWRRLQLAAK